MTDLFEYISFFHVLLMSFLLFEIAALVFDVKDLNKVIKIALQHNRQNFGKPGTHVNHNTSSGKKNANQDFFFFFFLLQN